MTTATGAGLRLDSRQGRGVLIAAVLASGMALLDSTVVNVALPVLGDQLDASLAGLQWTINGYTLTLASFILLGGSLGDRYGRRRIFLVGVVWFALTSLLCGLAPNITLLVAARALQGVGGALLTPGSLALLQSSFVPADRARAIGSWSGLGGIAAAVGPLLGGYLVESVSWRWVFLLNVPVAVAVVAVAVRFVPESHDASASHRFDVAGAALGAIALGGSTVALVWAEEQGLSTRVLLAAAVGLLAGVAFVVVEHRETEPMLPPALFASAQFTAANLVTFAVYAALGALFFFLVVDLQVVAGFSAIASGSSMLPVTVIMLLLSSRAGALAQRIGPRRPMVVGPLLCGGGMLLLLRVGPDASYLSDVLPGVSLLGLGLATVVAPLTATVLGAADDRYAGVASGVNNAVARAAGLLAVAALPLAVGLGGDDYRNPAAFDTGYRMALVIAAVLLVLGAALSAAFIRDDVLSGGAGGEKPCPRPESHVHCAVGAPPYEHPDVRAAVGQGAARR